jgi:hypothetical protein
MASRCSRSLLQLAVLALVAALALARGAHALPGGSRKMLQVLYGTSDLQTRSDVAQNSAQASIARAFLPTSITGQSASAATQQAATSAGLVAASVPFGYNGYLLTGK